jgi:hypothetical protein
MRYANNQAPDPKIRTKVKANPKLAPVCLEPEARTNDEAVAEAEVEVVELETMEDSDETAADVDSEVAELEVKPIGKVSVVLMAASDDAALNLDTKC